MADPNTPKKSDSKHGFKTGSRANSRSESRAGSRAGSRPASRPVSSQHLAPSQQTESTLKLEETPQPESPQKIASKAKPGSSQKLVTWSKPSSLQRFPSWSKPGSSQRLISWLKPSSSQKLASGSKPGSTQKLTEESSLSFTLPAAPPPTPSGLSRLFFELWEDDPDPGQSKSPDSKPGSSQQPLSAQQSGLTQKAGGSAKPESKSNIEDAKKAGGPLSSKPGGAPGAPTPPGGGPAQASLFKSADELELEEDELRIHWGGQLEFLMSCIATSVGLGNIWRFPFVAFQNGGGAFLIPYVTVLLLVGKPMYYLEGILGQFSSRNSVQIWSLSPAMKGVGYASCCVCGFVLSYYVSIVALCMYYFAMSFQKTLPWSVCEPEWGPCVPSISKGAPVSANSSSSAELYFVKSVLKQSKGIHDGLGAPVWYLAMCLFFSWSIIFGVVSHGIQSSGKAAYFLALFPYVIMVILFITTIFFPGSGTGMLFFLTPQWNKIIHPKVWYAAVTQVFFSLGVCTGAIVMFSSYNSFQAPVYRDAMIVTTLDTFTSMLSGLTIFGILGNLAHNMNVPVSSVIGAGGTSLAFVSYPDAIAKSIQPQLFSVMFFIMMLVLGIGSALGLLETIIAVMADNFPRTHVMVMSAIACSIGFLVGLIYVTPGGQYILELVDNYGGTFLCLLTAIAETVGVAWIYGVENICLDIEYMSKKKTGTYFRVCWGVITPGLMIIVFIYGIVTAEKPKFGGTYVYPTAAYVFGYMCLVVGAMLLPIFMIIAIYKHYKKGKCKQSAKVAFKPDKTWGPRLHVRQKEWRAFKTEAKEQRLKLNLKWPEHIKYCLNGLYRSQAPLPTHAPSAKHLPNLRPL